MAFCRRHKHERSDRKRPRLRSVLAVSLTLRNHEAGLQRIGALRQIGLDPGKRKYGFSQ